MVASSGRTINDTGLAKGMIAGIFHQGSGLGNQLHRYVATRVLAEDKGFERGMVNVEGFKGRSFMDVDMGKATNIPFSIEQGTGRVIPVSTMNEWMEKKVLENGLDIRSYDPEINFVEDDTIIDGEFQDSKYFDTRLSDVEEWLKTEPMEIPDSTCLIGFRGGEFTVFPELFLTKDYWDTGIGIMRDSGVTRFEVHTDDPITASKMFPEFTVIHDISTNWRSMRYAKNAIISNSSFYIFSRLLSGGFTIAPRYWARRNIKVWAGPSHYYKQFTYI